jgi:hypothetical protein
VQFVESQPTFRGDSTACYTLYAYFSLGLFFDPEDESEMFLRNVG